MGYLVNYKMSNRIGPILCNLLKLAISNPVRHILEGFCLQFCLLCPRPGVLLAHACDNACFTDIDITQFDGGVDDLGVVGEWDVMRREG